MQDFARQVAWAAFRLCQLGAVGHLSVAYLLIVNALKDWAQCAQRTYS